MNVARVHPFAPLRHRDFRLLWSGLVISNVGSWMQFVALGYLVDRLSHSALYLGVLGLSQALPRIVLSVLGGAVADRVDRRRLLFATNLFLTGSALVLTVLTVAARIRIWEVFLIGGLNSAVQAFDMPARHSMVPSLVEEREVLAAVSLNSVAFNGAGILGPSLGGVVIAAVGEAGCFFLNALSFVGVLVALFLMVPLAQDLTLHAGFSEDVREGLRLVRRNPRLSLFLGTVAILSFFGRPYIRMMPTIAREVLHVDPEGLGLLQSAPGVGTLCSALLMGWVSGSGKGRLLAVATLLFGLTVFAFGFAPWFWLALVLLVAIGLTQTLALSAANALIQLNAPAHVRGRMMGLYGIVTFGAFALGSFPVGALAGWIGIGPALSVGGVVIIVATLLLLPRLRGIE